MHVNLSEKCTETPESAPIIFKKFPGLYPGPLLKAGRKNQEGRGKEGIWKRSTYFLTFGNFHFPLLQKNDDSLLSPGHAVIMSPGKNPAGAHAGNCN